MPRFYDPAIADRKRKNTEIFKETTDVIGKGYYTSPSGKKVVLPSYDTMINGAECVHRELPRSSAPQIVDKTRVTVENTDCLVAAQRLVSEGYKPALLNFASAGHPGGGVETGARAQEETICRRSTLSRSIYTFDAQFASRYGYNHVQGGNYPLSDLNHSIIYSPGVTVFREGIDCTFMETPYSVAVITCAALNLNGRYALKLTSEGHMPQQAVDITLKKIRAIFRMALRHGHDSLVLGAFGCGAFKNPPAEVAALFHKVMEEPEFKNSFRYITFSIIEDHNSGGVNLSAFEKEFSGDDGRDILAPEYTPERISSLKPNEVFVFGSNLQGAHGGGAARVAYDKFGAEWGVGVGPTGQCYAIPTMHGGPDIIKPYVDEFLRYADENSDKTFLVTPIGCGIAGFKVSDIAPLFRAALNIRNVVLPESFVRVLK